MTLHLYMKSRVKFVNIQGNYQHITEVKRFSDGCAAQYNNYKNLLNLCQHYSHSGLEVDWDFFATNHAKLAADGIGEAVKPLTERAGLQIPYNNQTLSEETIYQFCSKTIENMLIYIHCTVVIQVTATLLSSFTSLLSTGMSQYSHYASVTSH